MPGQTRAKSIPIPIPSNHLTNPRATPRGALLEKEREPNLL